ncbi:recombinase family protein [Enterococcus sp. LJL99]
MNLGYIRGRKINQQIKLIENYGLDELFLDETGNGEIMNNPNSEYQQLLSYSNPGDCLVIAFLEVISRDYQMLLAFFDELEELELDLVVLTSPELDLYNWREVINWTERNDRLLHPRLVKLKKQKEKNKKSFSVFSRDPEAKRLYRDVMKQLLEKKKLRNIATINSVPIETIYWIQQEFKRIKLAVILAICFFLAIGTIKIAEVFSDNIWIQIGICLVGTLTILYNTLTENEDI